jgi:hypothetical protein
VLIDLADTNEAVLGLIAQHLAQVIIPTPVLAEVDGLDELRCAALGLEVLEPTLDQLREAAIHHPALSFADKVCMIVARDAGGMAWTNDGPLGMSTTPTACRGCAVFGRSSRSLKPALFRSMSHLGRST